MIARLTRIIPGSLRPDSIEDPAARLPIDERARIVHKKRINFRRAGARAGLRCQTRGPPIFTILPSVT